MKIDAQVINARTQASSKGDKYQVITLLDLDPQSPLEHMLQMSGKQENALHSNESLKGKRVAVAVHKIEQFAGEIRVQGDLTVAQK